MEVTCQVEATDFLTNRFTKLRNEVEFLSDGSGGAKKMYNRERFTTQDKFKLLPNKDTPKDPSGNYLDKIEYRALATAMDLSLNVTTTQFIEILYVNNL